MKKFSFILYLLMILFYLMACAPAQQVPTTPVKTEKKTEVVIEKPVEKPTIVEQEQKISPEVQELLAKSKVKIKNIYYKYRGPETGNNFYEYYIKNDKLKYKPARDLKALDAKDSFDVIFIDKTTATAMSYCEAAFCLYKGKKADLNYNTAYIQTIFDWINGLIEAKKVGEEVIDDRTTWKVETNKGILWLDTFYGIPLKVESNGQVFRFEQIAVNSVQDSDVKPIS